MSVRSFKSSAIALAPIPSRLQPQQKAVAGSQNGKGEYLAGGHNYSTASSVRQPGTKVGQDSMPAPVAETASIVTVETLHLPAALDESR